MMKKRDKLIISNAKHTFKKGLSGRIDELARSLHGSLFPEEYDYMFDSYSDARMREQGLNPMSNEYVDEVNKRRAELGVSPLSPSGMAVDNGSMDYCVAEAKKQIFSALTLQRIPSENCVICQKSLEEVGGQRILRTAHIGIVLTGNQHLDVNPAFQQAIIKLHDERSVYGHVWAETNIWNDESIQRVADAFRSGHHPWICQKCISLVHENSNEPTISSTDYVLLQDNGAISYASKAEA